VLIGCWVALLGFAIAVQVHSNSSADRLSGLRDGDLISILDDQNARADKLRQPNRRAAGHRAAASSQWQSDSIAQQQAEQLAQQLSILLGTAPATGRV